MKRILDSDGLSSPRSPGYPAALSGEKSYMPLLSARYAFFWRPRPRMEVLCHQSACQLSLQVSLNSSMSSIGAGPKQKCPTVPSREIS